MSRRSIANIAALIAFGALASAQVPVATSVVYKLVNKNSGRRLCVEAGSVTAGAAIVQAAEERWGCVWHMMPAGNGQYKIVNAHSGELLGITNASRAAGVAAVQWADNGTADHLWQIADGGNGYVKIVSVNSGLPLAVGGASLAPDAAAVQQTDDGDAAELWQMIPAGPAYPLPESVTGDTGVHDPSMIRTTEGTYYLFGTHLGILMTSSPDRVHFTTAGQAFASIPAWTTAYSPARDLWAPDISYHDGAYWLYYAASQFGSPMSAIGVATSATAAPGSFADQGMVISSSGSTPYNAIDPALVVDAEGGWWLAFGSYSDGINLIQIDPATGKQLASNKTVYLLAQRPADAAIEGSYIYLHDGYYYLFASFDACCQGVNSTYHIAVGRSSNVTGPYSDKGGLLMTLGGGTILLSTDGGYFGPGGETVMRDGDDDLLVYHYYDANSNGAPMLGLNRLGWDSDGWPFLCQSSLPISHSGRHGDACKPEVEQSEPPRR